MHAPGFTRLDFEFMRGCQSLWMTMRFCQAPETLLDAIGF